jgi:hypothetical protein
MGDVVPYRNLGADRPLWLVVGPCTFAVVAFSLVAVLQLIPGHRTLSQEAGSNRELERVEQALATRDVAAARRAWRDAHAAALASGRWDRMLAVGDVHLRLGALPGYDGDAHAQARETYVAAMLRARREGAVDGLLRAAEAFARLGDRAAAAECLGDAEHLMRSRSEQRTRNPLRAVATVSAGARGVSTRDRLP